MIVMSSILIAGLILLVFGLFLILSSAFRTNMSWAWAIIFFPVIYPVYSFLYWAESKVRNGFLVSVIGTLLVATAIYGGAFNELQSLSEHVPDQQLQHHLQELNTKLPQAGPLEKPLPNEAQAGAITFPEGEHYDPIYGDENLAYSAIDPLPPKEDQRISVPNPQSASYAYKKIEFAELGAFHGKSMKLVTKQGDTKEGKLIDSNDASLSLQMPFKNGFAAFEYDFDNITDVLIYDKIDH